MGIVDRAKRLHARLVDATTPHRVLFHHVPKCGGTSVGRALRKRYALSQATVDPEASFRAFESYTGRTDREEMLVDVLDLREQMMLYLLHRDTRCISLHVPFSNSAWQEFHPRYRFVTILREPVSRFISHFFWSQGRAGLHGRIEEQLEPFLETPRAVRMGGSYVEYYGGPAARSDVTGQKAIEAALINLEKFDLVGRLDRLAAFEADLSTLVGARIRIGHENRMRQDPSAVRAISPDLRARIERICAPDIAIWNAVVSGRYDRDR